VETKEVARCRKCRRRLSSPEAVAAGFGPVCFRKMFGRSLSCSPVGSVSGHVRKIKPHTVSNHRVLANQISVFDMQEVSHGTDAQTDG